MGSKVYPTLIGAKSPFAWAALPVWLLVVLIFAIAAWIGWSMLTTPPPVPLEELRGRSCSVEGGQETNPFGSRGNLPAGDFDQRRVNILKNRGRCAYGRFTVPTGNIENEGNPRGSLVGVRFAEEVMVAEHFTVI